MTMDERYAFNDTQLSFISIQKQIDKNTKCNLLQQGKRVKSGTVLRNTDHPITNYIRDNNISNKDNYNKYWKDIINYKKINNNYDKILNKIIYFNIRLMYITDKNSLEVNYNDQNILKSIRSKSGPSNLSKDSKIENIYQKIVKINIFAHKTLIEYKIIEEFYYLIHKLIMNNHPLIKNIKLLLNNETLNTKYNSILSYKKSVNSTIVVQI